MIQNCQNMWQNTLFFLEGLGLEWSIVKQQEMGVFKYVSKNVSLLTRKGWDGDKDTGVQGSFVYLCHSLCLLLSASISHFQMALSV